MKKGDSVPGYVIHLTEAKMICEILKQGDTIKNIDFDIWQKEFFYGSLLPDAGGKSQKQKSHFWKMSENNQIIMVPDIEKFLKKYIGVLKQKQSPLCWGYLAHLYLDRTFWECYIKQNIKFLNVNGEVTEYLKDLKWVFVKEANTIILPEEFFSEDYLYGDYTILNRLLIQKYDLRIPVYNKYCDNRIEEADNEGMKQVLAKLKMCTTDSMLCNTHLRVLSLNTLELFLRESAQQFVELYGAYLSGE